MRTGFVIFLSVMILGCGFVYAQEKAETQKAQAPEARKYDFGDMTSQTLATNAWHALEVKDFNAVYAYAGKCIDLYKGKALVMQASLTDFPPKGSEFDYWALNDVATCYFIKGKALKEQGKLEGSKNALNTVIKEFYYGQCWDPKGFFWKPAEAAKDLLNMIQLGEESGREYDFGDYTSMILTTNAWGSLDKKDYKGVEIYTKKCIELYESEALKQQAKLTEYLPREKAFDAWALNDVGTCYFILGDALMTQGKYKEAKDAYSALIEKYSFSQCWDPRGWFWKPAVSARGKINKIIAEHGDKL